MPRGHSLKYQPLADYLAALPAETRGQFEDVIDATRYVETGQKTGNVVLTVVPDGAGAAS